MNVSAPYNTLNICQTLYSNFTERLKGKYITRCEVHKLFDLTWRTYKRIRLTLVSVFASVNPTCPHLLLHCLHRHMGAVGLMFFTKILGANLRPLLSQRRRLEARDVVMLTTFTLLCAVGNTFRVCVLHMCPRGICISTVVILRESVCVFVETVSVSPVFLVPVYWLCLLVLQLRGLKHTKRHEYTHGYFSSHPIH